MANDPEMAEIYRIKDQIGARYGSMRDLVEAIRRFTAEHPLPPTPARRKMLDDSFPKPKRNLNRSLKAANVRKKPPLRPFKSVQARDAK